MEKKIIVGHHNWHDAAGSLKKRGEGRAPLSETDRMPLGLKHTNSRGRSKRILSARTCRV